MGSDAIIQMPNFTETGSGIQELLMENTYKKKGDITRQYYSF
jgi:hypothetical protein